uniref:Actin n=1 Tax=Phaeomonas parva TaxID=124430 RepID=A0A7S1XUW7_9STRA|mmetsp:Transcript_39310/g.123083  ORF Transcript_39310/g.123083 Transcript_39310/m.123083 type:complete len:382 (+) Transcript_39310:188-1333(+)
MDLVANQPVVIDNGTGLVKAGFAGADRPRAVFPCCVGRPKHERYMPGGALEASGTGDGLFVGDKVLEHRGALRLSHPMEHGVVSSWADMEAVWGHVYAREQLNTPADQHPVLLTEAPLNPDKQRSKCAEVFFETFGAPALHFAPQALLSLYASGRTSGVVLDVGDGVAHAVPVYEGFALPHAVTRMDVAGREVTEQLQLLLRRSGYSFVTSAERDLVREIKEQRCYVAFDPAAEARPTNRNRPAVHTLPDGTALELSDERWKAPELLFDPGLIGSEYGGVQHCLVGAIRRSDLELRRTLFSQVVLAGGTTNLPGFPDRMLNEVRKLSPRDMKIRIAAPQNRHITTWVGGSILTSLNSFRAMWITKKDYDERGALSVAGRSL